LGHYDEALTAFTKTADRLGRSGVDDPISRCDARCALAQLLLNLGRYQEAKEQLTRAQADADKVDDPLLRSDLSDAWGDLFARQGKHEEALAKYEKAAEALDRVDNARTRCTVYASLGSQLIVLKRPTDALPWLERAVQEAERTEDAISRGNAYRALANALGQIGRYDEALIQLQQAEAEARKSNNPLSCISVSYTRALVHFFAERWHLARSQFAETQQQVLAYLSSNRDPKSVGELMSTYGPLFAQGLTAAQREWESQRSRTDAGPLWAGLSFVDGAKCVAIREALIHHNQRNKSDGPTVWRSGSAAWRVSSLAGANTPYHSSGVARAALRGVRTTDERREQAYESILELPGAVDSIKNQYCQPISRKGVARLLPDRDTVLIVFYFAENDLIVLPLRRNSQGEPNLLWAEDGFFRVPGALPLIRDLLQKQGSPLKRGRDLTVDSFAAKDAQFELTSVYQDLYSKLKLDSILALAEPDRGRWHKLHLVLIPDGPLYLLPIHAACAGEGGQCLYQQVASVRYALSLRTLELQQDVQESAKGLSEEDWSLRGVAFANPDREPIVVDGEAVEAFLPGVIAETGFLVAKTDAGYWWLHGDGGPEAQLASRANFRRRHTAGNLGWVMCHGGTGGRLYEDRLTLANGREVQIREPALRLVDGPVSMSRLLAEGYDFSRWRLLHLSACMMGELTLLGASKEVLGYLSVLTLLGCRRVVSALWEVSDDAAPEFASHWIESLVRHAFTSGSEPSPHAFAVAFKEALDGFRTEHNRFDHEFFWAAFTLYGLG
jgi:tetratricopeptide (TPR) repeat protein